MTEPKYIDVNKLYFAQRFARVDPESFDMVPVRAVDKKVIDNMTGEQVVPAKFGNWIKVRRGRHYSDLYCSECRGRASDTWINYCGRCGAQMLNASEYGG